MGLQRVRGPRGEAVFPRAQLVLASASPQRRAILEQLGIDFRVQPANVDELTEGEPREVVLQNALAKLRAVPGELVLACDTEVNVDGVVFGKPEDEDAAAAMIAKLAGRRHEVLGGLVLRAGGEERSAIASTIVEFRPLERSEVDWYIRSGEWAGRAGGYAIQGRGAALVERIDGDFWNVVGLPVPELVRLLKTPC